jgi:predicted dithiol-disulfide oxidoreductase (DUF899 family)
MSLPRVVSREQWLSARKELLAKEKEHTRLHDAVAADRRRLPMVRIEKDYKFEGPNGQVSLAEMFEGCRQLIVQHFMFDPSWDAGCPTCAASSDELTPNGLAYMRARNTAFVTISRAPFAKISAYKRQRGWTFPWYSSYGTAFNYDFHVTLDEKVAPVVYDYQTKDEILAASSPDDNGSIDVSATNELVDADLPVEIPGISCFLQDSGKVFHTYSTYAESVEQIVGVRSYLELTALGGSAR